MLRHVLPLVALAACGCGSPALSDDDARRAAVRASETELRPGGEHDVARHLYVQDGDVAMAEGAYRVTEVVYADEDGGPAVRTDRVDGDTIVVWVPGARLVTANGDVTLPTQRFVVRSRGDAVVAHPSR